MSLHHDRRYLNLRLKIRLLSAVYWVSGRCLKGEESEESSRTASKKRDPRELEKKGATIAGRNEPRKGEHGVK